MKKMIAITILLALVPLVSAQERVYQVELEYSSGAVAMAGIGLADSFPQDIRNPPDSGYRIELLSQQGETIFQHTFNFPLDTYIEPSQQCYDTQTLEYRPELCPPGEQPYLRLDHATAIINIPFSPAGKEINLYDPGGRLVLTRDVEGFSCGNLVCDARETRASCPADCAERPVEFPQEADPTLLIFAGIIVLAIIIMLVFLIHSHSRKQKEDDWERIYRKIRK